MSVSLHRQASSFAPLLVRPAVGRGGRPATRVARSHSAHGSGSRSRCGLGPREGEQQLGSPEMAAARSKRLSAAVYERRVHRSQCRTLQATSDVIRTSTGSSDCEGRRGRAPKRRRSALHGGLSGTRGARWSMSGHLGLPPDTCVVISEPLVASCGPASADARAGRLAHMPSPL